MQPQLKSKVRCLDREVGEVSKIIMDPLSHEVSHLVVSMNGTGMARKSVQASAASWKIWPNSKTFR